MSAVAADVVVVGAGPAGIAAAVRATEARRRVVVLDEAPNVGGQIWRHRSVATLGADARMWVDRLSRTNADVRRGVAVVDVIVRLPAAAPRPYNRCMAWPFASMIWPVR